MTLIEEINKCKKCKRAKAVKFLGWGSRKPKVITVIDRPFVDDPKKSPFTEAVFSVYKDLISAMGGDIEDTAVISMVKCGKHREPDREAFENCFPFLRRQISAIVAQGLRPLVIIASERVPLFLEFGFFDNYLGNTLGFLLLQRLDAYTNERKRQYLKKKIKEMF